MNFNAQKRTGPTSDSWADPEMGVQRERVRLEKRSDIFVCGYKN